MSHEEEDAAMFDPAEADEVIPDDEDAPMDSDDETGEAAQGGEELEIQLQNDSIAHFDAHAGNSIFCIAQHPSHPSIIATGGGDDEESKDIGIGFVFTAPTVSATELINGERESVRPLASLEGHTDSIAAMTFTLPNGEFLATGGLDGRLIAHRDTSTDHSGTKWTQHAVAQEVEEINWLAACPHRDYPNTIALGASDGSVWIYTITADADDEGLSIVQTYYIHTGSCTAGVWTPDGKLLTTVSEDASLYVWDVWGEGAAAGFAPSSGSSGQAALVGLTAQDERFKVEGGLFSIAVAPSGALVAVGGADGHIRVVGLPRIGTGGTGASNAGKGGGAKSKAGGGKQQAPAASGGQGQPGAILANLKAQDGSIETLDFSPLAKGPAGAAGGVLLLAAGSVDGSIVVFDAGRNFAVRRTIAPIAPEREDADEDEGDAIVKVEFVRGTGGGWLLTSAGYDGVLRRWDLRGGQSQASGTQGLVGEWRGHRGGGDGGGIMGFVQGLDNGGKAVTAGDDGVALVFDMTSGSMAK